MNDDAIATQVASRIVAKQPADESTIEITDFTDAYAVQDATVAQLISEFGEIAGYKIAWNNAAQIAQFAPNAPAVAHVFSKQVYQSGVVFDQDKFAQLVIEPEIIAVIGDDIIGSGHTAQSVTSNISHFHVGFEIMDRRNCSEAILNHPASGVANNIYNAGLVIGGGIPTDGVDFRLLETIVNFGDEELLRATNAAPQDPALAVANVANNLATRGKSMRSGDLVLCGTHLPPFEVEVGEYSVSMGALGTASFSYG